MELRKQSHVKKGMERRFFYKMDKKGLSMGAVVLIMIVLVVAVVLIVFNLDLFQNQTKTLDTCQSASTEKLSINSEFVCYDQSNQRFVFSVNRGDLELDDLLVEVETLTGITQFKIREDVRENFNGLLVSYPEENVEIRLVNKNSDRTYIATNINDKVLGIQIIPTIGGEQCSFTDSLNSIVDCSQTTIFS